MGEKITMCRGTGDRDVLTTGPWHRWFAWKPVWTIERGWIWLRPIWRQLSEYSSPTAISYSRTYRLGNEKPTEAVSVARPAPSSTET